MGYLIRRYLHLNDHTLINIKMPIVYRLYSFKEATNEYISDTRRKLMERFHHKSRIYRLLIVESTSLTRIGFYPANLN